MIDRDFFRRSVYCMDNLDGDGTATDCVTTFSNQKRPFIYPAPIAEAATECGFNYFLWPDERGFAINPKRLTSVHEISVEQQGGDIAMYITGLSPKIRLNKYNTFSLTGVHLEDGGSCLIMDKLTMVFLPIPPQEVERLLQGSIVYRPTMLRLSGPKPDQRLH